MIEWMYGAINSLFLEKTLCPKAFLYDKLHTFLFNNVRNGIFSNTDSLALVWNWVWTTENSLFFRIGAQTVFVSLSNPYVFCIFSMFRGADDLNSGNNIQNTFHKQKTKMNV